MSTLTTRVGGWPLSIIRDESGAMLGHIYGPVEEVPKETLPSLDAPAKPEPPPD